jgi:hypothetical protein
MLKYGRQFRSHDFFIHNLLPYSSCRPDKPEEFRRECGDSTKTPSITFTMFRDCHWSRKMEAKVYRGLWRNSTASVPRKMMVFKIQHWFLLTFYASRNQLEAYVKTLEQPKRLKKEEWRTVHTKLLQLPAGTESRLRLSGQILTTEQVQRAKRHALRDFDSSHAASSNGTFRAITVATSC